MLDYARSSLERMDWQTTEASGAQRPIIVLLEGGDKNDIKFVRGFIF